MEAEQATYQVIHQFPIECFESYSTSLIFLYVKLQIKKEIPCSGILQITLNYLEKNMSYERLKQEIDALKILFNQNSKDLSVTIVSSVAGKTKNFTDYKKNSVITCFLEQTEIEKHITNLQNQGVYVETYFNVEDFMETICKNERRPDIVFESSPKGTGRGRDTLLPALCDLLNIKHLGPDAVSNAIFSSKYHWYSILKSNSIDVPKTYLFTKDDWYCCPPTGMKIIFKLNNECASIGLDKDSVMFYQDREGTAKAKNLYKEFHQPIIAQEFIEGYEVEIPIIINAKSTLILPPVGIRFRKKDFFATEFFDYHTIYDYDFTLYDFNQTKPALEKEIYAICNKVIKIFDMVGFIRIDCRIDRQGNIYIFDINNDPDIGIHSSFDYAFRSLGYTNSDILQTLIGNTFI